jgi:hypothetical protein
LNSPVCIICSKTPNKYSGSSSKGVLPVQRKITRRITKKWKEIQEEFASIPGKQVDIILVFQGLPKNPRARILIVHPALSKEVDL